MNDEIYDTFDGWKARGRIVRAGEKSHRRNSEGKATFHMIQTVAQEEDSFRGDEFEDGSMDDFETDEITAYDLGADF